MKITNITPSAKLFLKDLRLVRQSQTEARRTEDQYLGPGQSVYLPNTSEVLRSVVAGDIRAFVEKGFLQLEDLVTLGANGGGNDSIVLQHNFRYPLAVSVYKKVGNTWVDGTGTVDITHDEGFTTTTITNTTQFSLDLLIRLL